MFERQGLQFAGVLFFFLWLSPAAILASDTDSPTSLPAKPQSQPKPPQSAAPVSTPLSTKIQLKKLNPIVDQVQLPRKVNPIVVRAQAPILKRTFKLNQPLTGGVTMNVPRTPSAVAAYLYKMRQIIQSYERIAVAALFRGNSKDPSLDSINEVTGHTVYMINQIRAIVPPAEMKNEHMELANTLAYFSQFIQNPGDLQGGGLEALGQLFPMMTRIKSTLDNYHAGVLRVIADYRLSSQLDPFGDEDEGAKQRLSDTVNSMQGKLSQPNNSALPGLGDFAGGDFSALGNMDLNSLTKQLQNVDTDSLNKLMGELNDGEPQSAQNSQQNADHQNIDMNSLNQILQQLNGQR